MSRLGVALASVAALAAGGPLLAQEVAAPTPRVTLVLPLRDSLALRMRPEFAAGGRLGSHTTPALAAQQWVVHARALIARSRSARFRQRLLTALGLAPVAPADTVRPPVVIPRPEDLVTPERPRTVRALASYADLGLDLRARLELKFDRLRNERCTAADVNDPASGCQGGFPTPSFDQQFRVRAGGIVSQRVNVNVDFDSEREFNANNNINVFYQGLEDEILRRVEVGNVTFLAPPSRFITAAIPGNSFGVQTEAQLGPLMFRTIVAQQKGSALRTREFTVGEVTTQPVDFEARDLDFESGRFFFVVNPVELVGYPDVDILNLSREMLLPEQQIAEVRIYRLKAQGGQVGGNLNLGGIEAIAIRRDSPQRVGPFSWELLVEGRDYYLDPSGAWFALATRLGADDFLAVSYVTTAGDTVGTFPSVNAEQDTLELIHEPRRAPDVPTFAYEMRNFYRVGGQDIDRATLALTLRVGNSEAPLDGQGTYLSRLGLALSTDFSTIDEFNRVFPRPRDPGGGAPVRDLYLVFPHLTPFADSTRLQIGERNDSLYRTPTYLLFSQGPAPRFSLHYNYEATGAGDRSNIHLGAIQIRAGSEQIFVGNRRLVRGTDYEIDYELGQVSFLDPDALFTGLARVRAEFEENQLFDDAPKTIFGLSTTYDLGVGSLSAVGIFQRERTISTRPTLGFEPEATFIGGMRTNLEFRADWLTRALNALPLLRTSVPSALVVNGEVAMSLPNANRAGAAYIEDFDRESALSIPLTEHRFQLGSAPSSGLGLPVTHLSAQGGFGAFDAVPLIWQNLVASATGALQFGPRDIDSTIALAGTGQTVETVLWLSLKPDTVGGLPDPITGLPRWYRQHTPGPRWRSIAQALGRGSGVGIDLSRSEFFEFWVLEDALLTAREQGAYLVFDFGTVFEDAVAFAPRSFTASGADTTFSGFQFTGLGRLDSEKDSLTNVFNAVLDDVGIHGDRPDTMVNDQTGEFVEGISLCDIRGLSGLSAFPLGDLAVRCTRGNRSLDTEDLDGDNRLDVQVGTLGEAFVRYVFPVGDDRFFVRDGASHIDGAGRTLKWRLYRIPFRADTLRVGQPNLRQIEALRVTVVAPDQGGDESEFWLALARMRITGAPWLKRAATPITGLSGSRAVARGEVIASIVTTENTDLGYTPPPGVTNQPERFDVGLGIGTVQINEKSLRLLARDLRENERAEAFIRFADEADKNFLTYEKLRVWARGRGSGWSEGDLDFYIKVGRDEHNFYLYRAPARTDTWEPEVIVDLQRWLTLRAQVESAWLRGEPPSGAGACGGDSTAYVACDGPYFVQVRDPGTSPPNLARVSEVAVGMFRARETVAIQQAEVWVDEIRLSEVVDDRGLAAAFDVRLSAADIAEVNVSLSRRDDRFRQLGEDPTYVTDAATRIGTVFRADKLLPESWGLSIPVNIQYVRSSADPFYVNRTDVRADALPSLRRPRGSGTVYDVSIRRARRGQTFGERAFLDPIVIQARRETAENVLSLSRTSTTNRQLRAQYNNTAGARTVRAAPGFLVRLVNSLPEWLRDSEFGKALRTARFRWNPYQIRFASTFTNNVTERLAFRVPVELPQDTALRSLPSIVHTWRNEAGIDLRPFSTLTLAVNYSSTRDLQDYGDSTTVGRLLRQRRRGLFGTDVGFERSRALTTSLNVAPVISSWLRPTFVFSSNFLFNRNPNRQDAVRVGAGSGGAFRVPETLTNFRRREIGTSLDLARLAQGISGDSGLVAALFRGLLPANLSYTLDRRSSFDRAPFEPGLRFQLGLGGLDEFREQAGVPATAANETATIAVGGGVRLPLGIQARLSYRSLRNTSWQRRGEVQTQIEQRNREWPSLSVTMAYTPPEAIRALLSNITAQGQYRVQRASSLQPSFGGADTGVDEEASAVRTENNSRMVAPSITATWIGGVVTTAHYSVATTEAVTSGNVTESERRNWGGNVSFAFRPPRSLVRLRSRIGTTLAFSSSLLAVCVQLAGSDECRTVSDSRRQQFDFRMDTGLTDALRGGLTFSYVLTDQRHTSSKLSQIVFTVFADINFSAGQVR
ncbi:MAG: cell surface protein SprA [Gemmatimonadales bacterium]|nr:cell surface protein SprA [Gemmatimonadales bacterium]NIN50047.1 cell surface protein SprA [Gemmatimonadales bacterium]NIP07511.1 cell surface protein SprA [Gemmatimonadales bacterium]NIS66862.1 cell surface protein SprA [Gemmatimonadales bacterium]